MRTQVADHRRRAGRPAALPPARPRGHRVGRRRDPVARSTSRRGSGPASSSSRPSTCSTRSAWASGCTAEGDRAPRHLPAVAAASGTTSTSSTWSAARSGSTARPRCRRTWSRPATPRASEVLYEVADTALHDLDDRPPVRHLHRRGRRRSSGWTPTSSSAATARSGPAARRRARDRATHAGSGSTRTPGSASSPTSPPSTDELIYAWHPDGFALHSMRSATVSPALPAGRPTTPTSRDWSDDRIWDGAGRPGSAHGQDGWTLRAGPDHRQERAADAQLRADADAARPAVPGRRRRAHRAADRREGAQPRRRRRRPARAGAGRAGCARTTPRSPTPTPTTALRRVWRCTHFSWWMTTMLHTSGDPFDAAAPALPAALGRPQRRPAPTGLAENYAGLPIGF